MSEKRDDGGPAFPADGHWSNPKIGAHTLAGNAPRHAEWEYQEGMALIDWFAGRIAAAHIAAGGTWTGTTARECYDISADLVTEKHRRISTEVDDD